MAAHSGRAFSLAEQVSDGLLVLVCAGEFDYAAVAPLEHRLGAAIDRGDRSIIVELSGATLLTSSVINVLFEANRRLRFAGEQLVVACSNEHVRKILSLTGFDLNARVYESLDDAVRERGP